MATKSDQTVPGNRPDQQLSGLIEDRPNKPETTRQRVDKAVSTLIALIPQLPEHGKEDENDAQTATTARLTRLQGLLETHLSA